MKTKQNPLSLRTSTDDARRFTRLDVKLAGHVSLVPESGPDDVIWEVLRPRSAPVIVTDLSATGLFFVSQMPYDLGQQVWVELHLQGTDCPIRGIIVRQLAHLRGGRKVYGCGVQFVRSRFAPRAVAAVLDYLQHRLTISRIEDEGRRRSIRSILAQK